MKYSMCSDHVWFFFEGYFIVFFAIFVIFLVQIKRNKNKESKQKKDNYDLDTSVETIK